MKKSKYIIVILLTLFIAATMAFWLRPHVAQFKNSNPASKPGAKSAAAAVANASTAMHAVPSGFGDPPKAFKGYISSQEFDQIRVSLPPPEDLPWDSYPLYSYVNSPAPGDRLSVVRILPNWLRQAAYQDANAVPENGKIPIEMTSRFVSTLIKLTDDSDLETAINATFALYQLGDYNGIALGKMKYWIENGANDPASLGYADNPTRTGMWNPLLRSILQELSLNKDHSLDDAIYNIWLMQKDSEGNDLDNRVDYAYYLEKNGRLLPIEYWLNRLQSKFALSNTLVILEARKPDGLVDQLVTLYKQIKANKRGPSVPALSAVLYNLTEEQVYLDDVLGPGGTEPNALAHILLGENSNVDVAAARMLPQAKSHEVTDIMYNAAIQDLKTHGGPFPEVVLIALLEQNTAYADQKYDQLKQILLSGEDGWISTTNDFAAMDFFRAHERNIYNASQLRF